MPTQTTTFTTGTQADNAPPVLVEASPANGTTGVATNTVIRIEFDEPIDPSAVNSTYIELRRNFFNVFIPVTLSQDFNGRVLNLVPNAPLEVNHGYTVIIKSGLRDLAGNNSPVIGAGSGAFQSGSEIRFGFTVGNIVDTTPPSIIAIGPEDGFTDVPLNVQVGIQFNELIQELNLDLVTISTGGVEVPVTRSVAHRDNLTLKPVTPLNPNTTYTVTVAGIRDIAGNLMPTQTTTFTTGTLLDNNSPILLAANPLNGTDNVPTNTVIRVEFDEPIDPSSVNTIYVQLRRNFFNVFIPVTLSQDFNGRVLNLVPNAPLEVNHGYTVILSGNLRDLAGNNTPVIGPGSGTFQSGSEIRFGFTVRNIVDTTPPSVIAVGPEDGFADVPINTQIGIQFDERIQDLNLDLVTLSSGGVEVPVTHALAHRNNLTLDPMVPLDPNTTYAVTIAGIRDIAGNLMPTQTTTFTTGNVVDLARPVVVAANPLNGTDNVPTNTVIRVEFDEPIDPSSMNSTYIELRRNFFNVFIPVTFSQSADGKVLSLTPNAPLEVNHGYTVILKSGLRDLAGNTAPVIGFGSGVFQSGSEIRFGFTVRNINDTTPPTVVAVGPANGFTDVPPNVQMGIQFNERVQKLDLSMVMLSAGGVEVPTTRALSTNQQNLVVRPQSLLNPSILYTVTLTGIRDIAGNLMPAQTFSFTTGAAQDTNPPVIVAANPPNGTDGVPTNTVIQMSFDEPIDPSSFNSTYVELRRNFFNVFIPVTFSQSADGKVLTMTPNSLLEVNHGYTVIIKSGLRDLAGNQPPVIGAGSGTFQSGSEIRFGFIVR